MILDNLKDQDFSNDEYKDEFISLVKKLNHVLTNLDLTKEDISCYNPFNNIIQIINR